MASLPTNSEARITAFMDATSSSRDEAIQHLEMTEWDVTAAVDIWFQDETEEAEEPEDDAEPAAASNPVPNPTTARTSGSIHTLNDINPTTSAEHGADDEDGSDNDYFAGGEKSGLAVHGNPHGNPPPARGANELLQGLFDRARRWVADCNTPDADCPETLPAPAETRTRPHRTPSAAVASRSAATTRPAASSSPRRPLVRQSACSAPSTSGSRASPSTTDRCIATMTRPTTAPWP
jgi:hypothetical protein